MTNPVDTTRTEQASPASPTVPATTPDPIEERVKAAEDRVRREEQSKRDQAIAQADARARKEEKQRAKERESALRGTYKQRLVQHGDQEADSFDQSVDMAAEFAELKQEKQATKAQADAQAASVQYGQGLAQQAAELSDVALDPNDPKLWAQPFSTWDEFKGRIKSRVRELKDAERQATAQAQTDAQRKEATDAVNSGGLDTLTAPAAGAVSKDFDASKFNPITDAGKLHELAAQHAASKVKPRR